MKRYLIIRVNDKTGARVPMTTIPLPHEQACTVLSNMCTWPQYPQLRNVLEEASE